MTEQTVTEQDPWWHSKRIYAGVAGLVVLVLGLFDMTVDAVVLTELLMSAGGLASLILAIWSKKSDPRPIRGQDA